MKPVYGELYRLAFHTFTSTTLLNPHEHVFLAPIPKHNMTTPCSFAFTFMLTVILLFHLTYSVLQRRRADRKCENCALGRLV